VVVVVGGMQPPVVKEKNLKTKWQQQSELTC
jgi:hypothetical protein